MSVEIYEHPPESWDEFVDGHPESKIYQLSKWNELIRHTFQHSIKYLVLKNNSDLKAVLPLTEFNSILFGRFSISLPFINYGGILMHDEGPDNDEMWNHLRMYREDGNFDFIELRMDRPIKTKLPVKKHKVTFLLTLPDNPEDLLNSFKAKVRNQIRRPLKEAMYTKSGNAELLDDFYRIFSINMRDLGTPALPKIFFRNIMETFPNKTSIICVYSKDHKPVASSFLTKYKTVCEIPWASSLRKYNRFSPNMLLYWESFKNAIESGCQQFDMGRCSLDSGSYRFKRQWDAEEKPLFWYYVLPDSGELPELNPSNPKYNLLIKTWQKLPVVITNLLSPLIIKNIP